VSPVTAPRGARVEDGSLLAEEVGQDHEAVGAGGVASAFRVEPRVARLALAEITRKHIGKPLHEGAAGHHAAVEEKATGQVVVVDVEARVGREAVHAIEHIAPAPDLEHQLAGPGARRQGGGDMIGAARDDGDPRPQPVAAAADGVSAPTTSCGARTGGSHSSGISVAASAGAYQPSCRASQKPASSAQFRSRLHSSVSR
jgi:hypothetical protein